MTTQQDRQDDEEVWDIMEALVSGGFDQTNEAQIKTSEDDTVSLLRALRSSSLDGTAFGAGNGNAHVNGDKHASNGAGGADDVDIPNFPELSLEMLKDSGPVQRTSEPIAQTAANGQSGPSPSTLDVRRFQAVLDTPMGLLRFREWLEDQGKPESRNLLRYYEDVQAHATVLEQTQAVAESLRSTYGSVVPEASSQLAQQVQPLQTAALGMRSAQKQALDKLYVTEFKSFVAGKITQHAKARLEALTSSTDRGDLGDVFCLADPRLPDQPLVYVSDGFCRLSEYPRSRLVGRNCRFLQGPETDPEAVKLLRDAIVAGKEHCSLLLNYTRTGKPFWNLLNMIPLKDARGRVEFFLGAQVNVSRSLTSQQSFDTLIGGTRINGQDSTPKTPVLGYSEEVMKRAEYIHGQAICLPRAPISTPYKERMNGSPIGSPTPSLHETDIPKGRIHKWMKSTKSSDGPGIQLDSYPSDPLALPAFPQKVPRALREQIEVFSSAYSSLIVIDAKSRLIRYVTAPLLAKLGHPIRHSKDRLSSSLLQTDIVDLLTAPTSAETDAYRKTIAKTMADGESHSMFVGLAMSDTRRATDISSERNPDGRSYDGRAFSRSLIHLTPVKDGQDRPIMYVAVVG